MITTCSIRLDSTFYIIFLRIIGLSVKPPQTLTSMAKNFNAAQIKEVQETFNRFDKDDDGSMSTKELVSSTFHSLIE